MYFIYTPPVVGTKCVYFSLAISSSNHEMIKSFRKTDRLQIDLVVETILNKNIYIYIYIYIVKTRYTLKVVFSVAIFSTIVVLNFCMKVQPHN